MITKKRDPKIDILRFIGLTGIFLAHTQPPNVWFAELLNFEVTLIALMLGTSFFISNRNKNIEYLSYLKKRFVRLVVSTWIFLSMFFLIFYLVSVFKHDKYYFSFEQIKGSYKLLNGIGYVWIMRVFFMIAIVSPLLLTISRKIKKNLYYFCLLVPAYLFYLLLMLISGHLTGSVQQIYDFYIVYGCGFCLIAAFGIRLPLLSKTEINYYCLFFLVLFLSLTYFYQLSPTQLQTFKYSPKLYYISYGLFVSLLFYRLLDIRLVEKVFENRLVNFVSKSSAWLYFWHIIPCYIIVLFGKSIPFITNHAVSRFIFILSSALLLTWIHENIVARIKSEQLKRVFQ